MLPSVSEIQYPATISIPLNLPASLEEELNKVTFYNTNDTREIKKSRALAYKHLRGSDDRHSGMWLSPMFNRSVRENEHDVALFLCDDDLLITGYFSALKKFLVFGS